MTKGRVVVVVVVMMMSEVVVVVPVPVLVPGQVRAHAPRLVEEHDAKGRDGHPTLGGVGVRRG